MPKKFRTLAKATDHFIDKLQDLLESASIFSKKMLALKEQSSKLRAARPEGDTSPFSIHSLLSKSVGENAGDCLEELYNSTFEKLVERFDDEKDVRAIAFLGLPHLSVISSDLEDVTDYTHSFAYIMSKIPKSEKMEELAEICRHVYGAASEEYVDGDGDAAQGGGDGDDDDSGSESGSQTEDSLRGKERESKRSAPKMNSVRQYIEDAGIDQITDSLPDAMADLIVASVEEKFFGSGSGGGKKRKLQSSDENSGADDSGDGVASCARKKTKTSANSKTTEK